MDEIPQIKNQWVFSIFSGETFEVTAEEFKKLDSFHIPLKEKPNCSSCKKCLGRLYTGFETKEKIYLICQRCIRKYVDYPAMFIKKK